MPVQISDQCVKQKIFMTFICWRTWFTQLLNSPFREIKNNKKLIFAQFCWDRSIFHLIFL